MKKALKHVGNRRLLKLAALLEKLPRERFDYGVYADWKGAPDLSCGTTACAIGWATTMPEFRKLGLRLARTRTSNSFGSHVSVAVPRGGSNSDAPSAGTSIFSLDENEWDYLFMPDSALYDGRGYEVRPEGPDNDATAKRVARHIRRFVAYREKQKAKR